MRSRVLGAEWSEPGSPCSPGRVTVDEYIGRQMIHRVQNVGTSPFRLVSIENLKDNGWSSSEPLSVAFTKILQDTRAFRIYEVSLHTSNDETLHVHSRPAIVILVSGGLIVSRGNQKEFLDQPGRWSIVAAGDSHRLTVGPSGEGLAVEVEVR
jgi:mannose-6-phosphate isomerase-like protein (cupin superfamily)